MKYSYSVCRLNIASMARRWARTRYNTQPDFACYLRQCFTCVKSMKKLIWRGVKPFNRRCLADSKQTFTFDYI